MCRLLGVIANKAVDLGFSFLNADTPFRNLGAKHPHGWGIGWYENGKACVFKEGRSTLQSRYLEGKAQDVRSHVIISHVRSAKTGGPSELNSHPFPFDKYIFAHNGTVNRVQLLALLEDDLRGAL